jgi:hypothetical protein
VCAVVVTTRLVPLIAQEPAGMVQLAVSVGAVAKPAVLIAKVNEPPAEPVCDGLGTTTAGAAANVAVIDVFAAGIAKLHVVEVLPAHSAPLQLVKLAPELGTAVRAIAVPEAKEVPVGDWVMVPGPDAVADSV